jgi:voltage-gated potassium channel
MLSSSQRAAWRSRFGNVIFNSDTLAGRLFDLLLIVVTLARIVVVLLDSVAPTRARDANVLQVLEWIFTALFSLGYLLRLLTARRACPYSGWSICSRSCRA